MAAERPGSFSRYVVGVVFGIAMTYAYVRFGYALPGLVQLGSTVASEAVVSTAEIDLYDYGADIEIRQRALAVVLGQRAELLIEIDNELDHQILEEVLRKESAAQGQADQETICSL